MAQAVGGNSPTLKLTPLEKKVKTLLLDVAQYIEDHSLTDKQSDGNGHKTVLRFTGGWVRDKLLGVESHDIDVAINNMTGYQFGTILQDFLKIPENMEKYTQDDGEGKRKHVSLHKIEANPEKSKHLETVTTKIFGLDIDLVNLRKETYTANSRTPQMEFGTAKEDALRRDATINALFYNLNDSKVEDLTEKGLEDMRDETIRTPLEPYQTFRDDPLRVLRLIRFASRLGFRIDEGTESAMQHSDIGEALKLKISRERVGVEVEKMLKGPDPRGALHIIDRLNIYPIIFANYQDEATADMTSWSVAYNSLHRMLTSNDEPEAVSSVRKLLVRGPSDEYYAWVIAAFIPWSTIAARPSKGKPMPPRTSEAARDGLRGDNKMVTLLKHASYNWRSIIEVKTALVDDKMQGTAAEKRQQIGLHMRSWGADWRLCLLLSILQEIMQGGDFGKVLQGYNQFLSYIVEKGLEDVCELKPIVNGGEIMGAFGGKKGPWLSKALEFTIRWQLLHPDIQDKQKALDDLLGRREDLDFRNAAREALEAHENSADIYLIPSSVKNGISVPDPGCTVEQLWHDISKNGSSNHFNVSSMLCRHRYSRNLERKWHLKVRSPLDVGFNPLIMAVEQIQSRQRSAIALCAIEALNSVLTLREAEVVGDVIMTVASFTSEADPWTRDNTHESSRRILKDFIETSDSSFYWATIESILKSRVRPVFAKSKNPAITESGRKNFHPVPLPRFDLSILDPETKPWKNRDAYIVTAFSWILSQYKPADLGQLEAHLPLLIPPLLALIDDETLSFKRRGCLLLSKFLDTIRESQSDILRRTNLASVFEEALRPCFHSLPTITSEDDSIQLLSAAYPALRSILRTSYRMFTTADNQPPSAKQQKNHDTYISTTTKTLREHLIPSFHHISSTDPTSISSFASFPHPRLSTFLLNQIAATCSDLGIHTTKYLQDIIPLIYSTLSNPFGTAHPPLLLAALSALRAVILNAYPRIWRWRGELFGAICSCWLHVTADETENKDGKVKATKLDKLKKELQGAVHLLRYALENPAQEDSEPGQRDAKEKIEQEIQNLVDADESLRECLLAEIDSDDSLYFGLDE
ncbi:tRNA adenylyltransferase [Aspergillus stella-maris]|uniref:tRNA adenylyltransferase n=1 Tax=Aspergillus stella-maris TaxID=1810926 RepID=UPI003CCCE1DA